MAYIRVDKSKVLAGCKAVHRNLEKQADSVNLKYDTILYKNTRKVLTFRRRYMWWLRTDGILHSVVSAKRRALAKGENSLGWNWDEMHRNQELLSIGSERRKVVKLMALCVRGDSTRIEIDQADAALLGWDKSLFDISKKKN